LNTIIRRMFRALLVLLMGAILVATLLLSSCARVQLAEGSWHEGLLASIPFQLYGSIIFIEISVDESAPLQFIFDTGAGGTIINNETAVRLDIIGDETVSREGATGMAEIVQSTDHIVYVEDICFQDITLGIAELGHIEKRIGTQIDGVIGWLLLSRYAVRIDYDTMLIEIYDNKKFDYNFGDSGYTLEVQGTTIFTNITTAFKSGNNFTGRVLVDTGAGNTFYFNTPFIEENNLLAEIGTCYERETNSLSTESSYVYTTMLASLTIGDYKLYGLPVTMSIAETGALSWSGPMGILGNNVLKRFNIFIDLQQQKICLEPNQLYNEKFEINCSGLEIVFDDSLQNVVVDYVYADSPAEKIGLKVGDEVVQINGINTSLFQLPEIRSMLNRDETDIEILIDRKGELHSYSFRLQALIE
jgi:hypothetical protein